MFLQQMINLKDRLSEEWRQNVWRTDAICWSSDEYSSEHSEDEFSCKDLLKEKKKI